MKCDTPNTNKIPDEASLLLQRFARNVHANKVSLLGPQLAKSILACRPPNTTGAYAFKWDYLEKEILSKYADGIAAGKKERAKLAIEKLVLANDNCHKFNSEYISPSVGSAQYNINARSRQIIADLLGDVRTFLENDLIAGLCFTGGASVGNSYTKRDPFFKYGNVAPCCTKTMVPWATKLIMLTPLWDVCKIREVPGNTIFTVPKNAKIDRAACKEPELNQVFQTAVGSYISARLKTSGINLNDQSRNQKLALKGSIDGTLATLDLKDASNSISLRAVYELLPQDWFDLLCMFRSPLGSYGGKQKTTIIWSLFSTMGNGFTFELESLLFYAICKAASECALNSKHRAPLVSVYGDDIIVETPCVSTVISSLTHFGFTINPDKTFTSGPFRESCGAHFYAGYDVKPIYIRRDCDHPSRVIWLLNAIRRWGTEDGVFDPSVETLWLTIRRANCPSEFLGGDDLYGVDMVYSHDTNQARLLSQQTTSRINGPNAILRWFQLSDVPTLYSSRPYRMTSGNDRISTKDDEDVVYTVQLLPARVLPKVNGNISRRWLSKEYSA